MRAAARYFTSLRLEIPFEIVPRRLSRGRRPRAKRRTAGDVGVAISGLWRPGAAAFGPDRRLFVVERSVPARVLRFSPPPAPAISVTPFTNRTPIRIDGSSQRNSLIKAMPLMDGAGPMAVAIADPYSGAFSVTTPVAGERRDASLDYGDCRRR